MIIAFADDRGENYPHYYKNEVRCKSQRRKLAESGGKCFVKFRVLLPDQKKIKITHEKNVWKLNIIGLLNSVIKNKTDFESSKKLIYSKVTPKFFPNEKYFKLFLHTEDKRDMKSVISIMNMKCSSTHSVAETSNFLALEVK